MDKKQWKEGILKDMQVENEQQSWFKAENDYWCFPFSWILNYFLHLFWLVVQIMRIFLWLQRAFVYISIFLLARAAWNPLFVSVVFGYIVQQVGASLLETYYICTRTIQVVQLLDLLQVARFFVPIEFFEKQRGTIKSPAESSVC